MPDVMEEKDITPREARQGERVGLIWVLGIGTVAAIAGMLIVLVL